MGSTSKNWFKRRRYGYGWTPASWQGWSILAVYALMVTAWGYSLKNTHDATTQNSGIFLFTVILATAGLIGICLIKGPTPKWRWGKKDGDNADEDF